MVALKYEKETEQGFLLLESLVTLGMIASISLMLYPMIARWMILRQEAKDEVELNRVFYETSIDWKSTQSMERKHKGYTIKSKENKLSVEKGNQKIEVYLNGYEFEK